MMNEVWTVEHREKDLNDVILNVWSTKQKAIDYVISKKWANGLKYEKCYFQICQEFVDVDKLGEILNVDPNGNLIDNIGEYF